MFFCTFGYYVLHMHTMHNAMHPAAITVQWHLASFEVACDLEKSYTSKAAYARESEAGIELPGTVEGPPIVIVNLGICVWFFDATVRASSAKRNVTSALAWLPNLWGVSSTLSTCSTRVLRAPVPLPVRLFVIVLLSMPLKCLKCSLRAASEVCSSFESLRS